MEVFFKEMEDEPLNKAVAYFLTKDMQPVYAVEKSGFSRIVEQQQVICAVLAEDRKDWHRKPSENEFLLWSLWLRSSNLYQCLLMHCLVSNSVSFPPPPQPLVDNCSMLSQVAMA